MACSCNYVRLQGRPKVMNIQDEIEALTNFLPIEKIEKLLANPKRLLPENIDYIIPSITIGGDGLVLGRLMLVTQLYLCDIAVTDSDKTVNFDFVAKHRIANYRVALWQHEIKEAEAVKATYQLALVRLIHDVAGDLHADLTYAGNEREKWLQRVVKAIPIPLVLRG